MSLGRHTAYNLGGAVLPLALSLLTVPAYIALIGEARYGVLSVAFLLLGYFGLFDLGLGTATAQRIAAVGDASREEVAATFWTALLLNLGLGCLGGLLIWPVADYFFGHVFKADPALRAEMLSAVPWLALALPLATLSGVLTGALQGKSRFFELNLVSVVTSVLTQLVPLLVAWKIGVGLWLLLPAVVASRLVAIVILYARCRVHVLAGTRARFSRGDARALLHFGGWVTVTSLVGPLMVMLDRFVIGAMLGARSVAYYVVPFQLVEKSLIFPAALCSALFPRLSGRSAEESLPLARSALQALAALMTPLVVGGLFLIEPFLRWWLHPEFAVYASTSARILLLGFWANAFARIPYVALQAAGRPGVVARCHLAELLPYLGALYVGLSTWGLPGAALAFSVRAFADCGLLLLLAGFLRAGLRTLAVPGGLVLGSFALATALPKTPLLALGLATAGGVAAAGWAWFSAPAALRALANPLAWRRGFRESLS
jgi:O-antigen/teichoic acid export membrane protein